MSRPPQGPAWVTAARLLPLCKRVAWRQPEWWSLAASAAAWVLIVAQAASSQAGHHHGPEAFSPGAPLHAWWALSADWLVMVVAMMLPMVVEPIRTAAARSLWARRHRAIGGFLVGYLTPWILLGLLASGLTVAVGLGERLPGAAGAAIGFALAAGWQLTAVKWRAVRSCHRTMPLAPSGWRADRDCLSYGWMIGCRCLVSCWALMAACLLSGHGLLAMACAAAFGLAERRLPQTDRRLAGAAVAGLALVYAAVALR